MKALEEAASAEEPQAIQIAPDIRALDHWFFVGFKDNLGQASFIKSNAKVVKTGQLFGFRVKFKTTRPKLRVKVELHVPHSAEKFSSHSGVVHFGKDKKSVVVDYEIESAKETFSHYWGTAKGDPVGSYELKFSIEDVPIETYTFTVSDQAAQTNGPSISPNFSPIGVTAHFLGGRRWDLKKTRR